MIRLRFLSTLLALSLTIGATGHAQVKKYELQRKTTIGGDGGWDYLTADPGFRTLYLSHGSTVDVYDMDRDSIVRHIPNTEGVHGIAIADRDRHAFISCGKSNTVLMVDLRTGDTMKRIPVGEKPDAIIYELASKHIFVMNGKSENITVLDAVSGNVVTTIKLHGAPEFAVSDERGHVYVNLEEESKVEKIDVGTNTIEDTWSLGSGKGPTGIAMDRGTDRLFIGCGNEKLIVLNAENGSVIETLPIGKGVDAVVFDPFTKYIFSSNGEGTVSIFHEVSPSQFEHVQTLATQRGARTIALDPTTHAIYLTTAEFGPAPAATPDNPKPRPKIVPGSFVVLKYGPASN